jgi:SAM-dependent methyltransferase
VKVESLQNKPRDTKSHWEKTYAEKPETALSWYQEEPALSLAYIRHAGLGRQSRIIDVGGGASLLVDCLLNEGFAHIAVLDISAAALETARRRLGPRARQVEWIEQDITLFQPAQSYALWHDRALFHFLTRRKDRVAYVKALRRSLHPGSQVIIAAFAPGGPTMCSGLPIVKWDSAGLLQEMGEGFELEEFETAVHVTPMNKEQLFTYHRFVKS